MRRNLAVSSLPPLAGRDIVKPKYNNIDRDPVPKSNGKPTLKVPSH